MAWLLSLEMVHATGTVPCCTLHVVLLILSCLMHSGGCHELESRQCRGQSWRHVKYPSQNTFKRRLQSLKNTNVAAIATALLCTADEASTVLRAAAWFIPPHYAPSCSSHSNEELDAAAAPASNGRR